MVYIEKSALQSLFITRSINIMNSRSALNARSELNSISLENEIKTVLSRHFSCDPKQILFQENKSKYHNKEQPLAASEDLVEIFHLMKKLNAEAIDNPMLCSDGDVEKSFSNSLRNVVNHFAHKHQDQSINYIELGPEPIKTRFIIEHLLSNNVQINKYCAVDINPSSAIYMKESLEDLLPSEKIIHKVSSFEDFRVVQHVFGDLPLLVTMLGFQEGNDESFTMSSWMENIVSKNGYLLSEMQLLSKETEQQVVNFYSNPSMVRFSKVAFQRALGNKESKHASVLMPLTQSSGEKVSAMIMVESFKNDDELESHLVTNYCLKYDHAQYRQHRTQNQAFNVSYESFTGDKSIVFQLSQRT